MLGGGRLGWMGCAVGLVAGGLLAVTVSADSAPTQIPGQVHFTAAGDYGSSANTAAVLDAIGAASPDLNLALGDMSYGATGAEQAWCDFVTSRIGKGKAFELLAGNHESNGQNGNINDFSACLPNQLNGAVGTYGRQYYVDVPKEDPLVRFVMISPNLTFPDGTTWSYNVGSPRYDWTASAIDGARTASIPWVVVGMHKPCVSVGDYGCDVGTDLADLLLSKKVDLVLGGHEHLYQRTKQLGLGAGCTSLTVNGYNSACVKSSGSSLSAGVGTVFATVGTGGVQLRDVNLADPEAPYFVTAVGSNNGASFGYLDVVADATKLTAAFKPVNGGAFTDAFSLTKGAPPPNQPPTAAFTSTTSGLTANFDASPSTDPDDGIASYDWTFGDSTTGSGRSPSHAYASAGNYTVTLTVTDVGGLTAVSSKQVTVSAAPPPIARDDFQRTLSTGWGTAPVGGPWTVTGSADKTGVANGAARISMLTAGSGPAAYLNGVSSSSTDFKVDFTFDKVVVGGTAGIDQSFILRRVGTEEYRAKVRMLPAGVVRVGLYRVNTAGSHLVVAAEQNVPGLTYAANDMLTVRAQASGTSPTTLRVKLWRTADPEPSTWQLTATDSWASLQAAGSIAIHSYLSSSVTNAPIIARFDNLLVAAP